MLGTIFTFLIILLVGGVVTAAWFLDGFADLFASVRDFFVNTDMVWITGFAAVALIIAKVWNRLAGNPTGDWVGTAGRFFQVCCLAFGIWFGVIPLINANRWNADFKCVNDGDCYMDNECVGGFCVTPFMDEGEFIAKAEFTQGNYRAWVLGAMTAECQAIRNERKSDKCLEGVAAGVEARFRQMISREHCKYMNDEDTPESVLYLNDDAPMVCLSRDEAAQVCASFGGRLPAREDYEYMFDDRSFSCDNTVMFGIDEFHGYAKSLKAREIGKLTYGPGCGTGKFRRVCDKARGGNTRDGLCDVFGNVSEWASDAGAMGGSFTSTRNMMRDDFDWGSPRPWIGFRCIVPGGAVD